MQPDYHSVPKHLKQDKPMAYCTQTQFSKASSPQRDKRSVNTDWGFSHVNVTHSWTRTSWRIWQVSFPSWGQLACSFRCVIKSIIPCSEFLNKTEAGRPELKDLLSHCPILQTQTSSGFLPSEEPQIETTTANIDWVAIASHQLYAKNFTWVAIADSAMISIF